MNTASDWTRSSLPSVAQADDTVAMVASQKALEQMILDFTEGEFRDISLEIGHAKANWSSTHKLQDPCFQAGDAKVAWTETSMYVRICMTLNGNLALLVQHLMKQAQGTLRKCAQRTMLSVPDPQSENGRERKGKERKGKEGKERKGKERKGKERKGKERKGKERKGKKKKQNQKRKLKRRGDEIRLDTRYEVRNEGKGKGKRVRVSE